MTHQNEQPNKNDTSSTQIGLHSVKQLLGHEEQLKLFGKKKQTLNAVELPNNPPLKKFGFDLTDFEQRILEAILYGFTQTRYQGNLDPLDVSASKKLKMTKAANSSPYKYISEIPRLKTSQREIMKWAGLKTNSVANFQRTEEALKKIGSTAYCFYYSRLAYDENGNPIKNKDGSWKKEEVMAIDNLFTVKVVRNENSEKIEYYELIPSPIFLDQRENYFMLVPFDWREEVQQLAGKKKTSSYTFRFLLFLMYQFELKRRSPSEKKPYKIAWSWEEIAKAIKVPDSDIQTRKQRALSTLKNAYEFAKQLGYLIDFSRTETVDILWLNEDKYITSQKLNKPTVVEEIEVKSPQRTVASEMYQFLVNEKRKIDPKYNPTFGGPTYQASLTHLEALLAERSVEDIQKVITWGMCKSYWTTHIGTASKLRKNFHQAFAEMTLHHQKADPEFTLKDNRKFANFVLNDPQVKNNRNVKTEVFNKHIEIGIDTTHPTVISLNENGFKEQFLNALRKWGFEQLPNTIPA